MTIQGANGVMTNNLTFLVGNAQTMLNNPAAANYGVFPLLAGTNPNAQSFDYGLAFFYSRRVATAIEGSDDHGGYRTLRGILSRKVSLGPASTILWRQDRLPRNEHHGGLHRGKHGDSAARLFVVRADCIPVSRVVAKRPGIVGFEKAPAIDAVRIPVAASMTPALGANDICEVWRVAAARVQLSSGETRQGHVRYRYCDDLLFGSLTIAEQRR